MSSSWGHTIQPLVGKQRAAYVFLSPQPWAPFPVTELQVCASCPVTKKTLATYLATYRYVTGRAGRMAFARRHLCGEHAEKFRARYQPTELEAGPAPRHALEQALAPRDTAGAR